MKKNILLLLSLLIMIFAITGCSSDAKNTEGGKNPKGNEISEEEKEDLQKEREELEASRKEEMGEFYYPLPALGEDKKAEAVKAKALYITGSVAGFNFDEGNIDYYVDYIEARSGKSGKTADTSRLNEINKLERVLAIAKASEINALVIDIKDDSGNVTWESELEVVKNVASDDNKLFNDYKSLLDYLDKNEIYKIARIVAFKDPLFAKEKPESAIQLKAGGVYKDRAGESWVNPFSQYVWDYILAVSKEAAVRGFDEIQYDYVRFPDNAYYYNKITEFPERNDRKKDEGIEDFLEFARKELKPYKVHVAADVFGIVTNSWDDTPDDIGQTWRKVANQVEYICPMIYPSHYGPGFYGYDVPDREPYGVSRLAVMEAIERNAAQKDPAIIRPWFQGFSAPWVKGYMEYDAKAISDQMVAASELGVEEYIIWSGSNNYDPMSFFYEDRINKTKETKDKDILDRTPQVTLERFLRSQVYTSYKDLYLLTLIEDRKEDYDEFVEDLKKVNPVLDSYNIVSVDENEGKGYLASVDVSYSSDQGTFKNESMKFEIIKENEVFKIKSPKIDWESAEDKEEKEEKEKAE